MVQEIAAEWCDQWLPLRKCHPDVVLGYVTEVSKLCYEREQFNEKKVLQLWVLGLDKLGIHWQANIDKAVTILSNALGALPRTAPQS